MTLACAVLGLVIGACSDPGSIQDAIDSNELVELDDMAQLQASFNEDTDTPRLIMLLSPT